jgi:hypothetical protein
LRSELTIFVPEKRVFHAVRNTLSHAPGLRGALPQLRRRLPANWSVAASVSAPTGPAIVIRSPDGRTARLLVVSRSRFEPKDVAGVVAAPAPTRSSSRAILVTAPFLSPRTRSLLAAGGASYVDATGNLRLAVDMPAVFIEHQGAQKDPAPAPRSLRSLKGPAARRVVRALCELSPPYGIRQLARRAQIPAASVSRVVQLLVRDGLVTRGSRGAVATVDKPGLTALRDGERALAD